MQLVSETRQAVRRDRLLRMSEVETLVALKKSTIYQMMKRGTFPLSREIGPRCVRWSEAAVLQWVQDRIHGERQADLTDAGSAS